MHEYTIIESHRAKYVRLKVTLEGELVIVVPRGADRSRIPSLVRRENAWIKKAKLGMARQRRTWKTPATQTLPERIDLQAIGEVWPVDYRQNGSARVAARELASGRLRVTVAGDDVPACAGALKRWTSRKARERLIPRLQELSDSLGMPFERAAIRGQRTRWASCSPRGIISLNHKLLFLPPRVVDYVLVHELCHTVHLNHSRRFWALVCRHEPDSRELDRELKEAWRYVPWWICDPAGSELNQSHA
jgi:hypothetical protein